MNLNLKKMNYKWPSVSSESRDIKERVQQAISIVNKKTNQMVSTTPETIGIGSACIVFYFLTLLYIYGSAVIIKSKILKKNKSIFAFFKEFKMLKGKEKPTLNTLSTSFEYSERIGTTVCLIIFLALLQGLFSSQNIYSTDPRRASIIAFNYIIVMCWLLFLYIFPSVKVEKVAHISHIHFLLACCVLGSLIINCFLVIDLYSDYFDDKSIEPLKVASYVIVGAAVIAAISMGINFKVWTSFPSLGSWTSFAVAACELICLIFFGIFLILFIQYPPVPDEKLSCILVPS